MYLAAGAVDMLQGKSPEASTTYAPEARIRSPLKVAVQAATDAYGISGRIIDAALAYAVHGFPIFPLLARTKAPIPRADKDANGRKIPRTGGFYKATCDQEQIRKWWDRGEFLIGLPMGPSSGVWALDIDTAEDHADGVKAWQLITAEQTKIHTRTHLSATGGLHLILNWNQSEPVGCGRGLLPDGVDSKGLGGYICVPPSRRKGRSYTVQNDVDPIDPPDWLIDMITSSPPLLDGISNKPPTIISGVSGQTATEDGPACALPSGDIPVDLVELASAVASIPNNNLPWDPWTKMGLAIFAATRGRGFAIFDQFSSRSSKYSAAKTLERWEGIAGSPPDRIGDQ